MRKILVVLLASFLALGIAGCSSKATKVSDPETVSEKASSMSLGQTVTLDNGLELTVTDVRQGYEDVFDDTICTIWVSYKNTDDEKHSFSSYDWTVEDKNGVVKDPTLYAEDDYLESGDLQPGGTASGSVTFSCDSIAKVYYIEWLDSTSDICWVI